MHDQERLVRVETEMELMRVGFGEVKTALLQLAGDMHQLSRMIFDQATREQERIEAQLQGEIKDSKRWLWEIGRIALAIIGALAVAKLGVHPL